MKLFRSKAFEIRKRGTFRLVINYKSLNKVLKWIKYLLSKKIDLIRRIHNVTIFFKFDMKYDYYQISVREEDKYKIVSMVSFGHYE